MMVVANDITRVDRRCRRYLRLRMVRIPPKRSKPAVELRGDRFPLSLTLPPELVAELDAIAAGSASGAAAL